MENKNQCYADYDATTNTGWGPGFQYACIHSGSNDYSGGNTTWYNYVLATAGTIFDENTTEESSAHNTMNATESLCPKGWVLPSDVQIRTIGNSTATYVPRFSPVLGGHYSYGTLYDKDTLALWWGNNAHDGVRHFSMRYDVGNLYTNGLSRHQGVYIRCIQAS